MPSMIFVTRRREAFAKMIARCGRICRSSRCSLANLATAGRLGATRSLSTDAARPRRRRDARAAQYAAQPAANRTALMRLFFGLVLALIVGVAIGAAVGEIYLWPGQTARAPAPWQIIVQPGPGFHAW